MSCVDPEICSRADRQAHHNTPLPCRSGVKSRCTFFKNAVETDRQTDMTDCSKSSWHRHRRQKNRSDAPASANAVGSVTRRWCIAGFAPSTSCTMDSSSLDARRRLGQYEPPGALPCTRRRNDVIRHASTQTRRHP